ncbi:endolytic transglycosylase MltG [Mariprofundus erugo]|uniref:endolytic transglycosylase MltG n=1 Tax=Mariprofundus erugo TaxID=2528639 RepID=UPI001EE96BEB|nr:endolytic transglycosylase MltG [Mariprofundus erugo]
MRKLIWLLLALLLLPLAAGGWFYAQVGKPYAPASAVELMIPPGTASSHIARMLEEKGVVSSALVFRLWLRLNHGENGLKSGLYRFEHADSMRTIVQRLEKGDVMHFSVTVPEGLRNDEIIQLLATQTGVPVEKWQQSLKSLISGETEGRLLPETWEYTKPLDPQRLLKTIVQAQQQLLDSLTSDAEQQQRLRIMASVIEKETALDRERPLVSAAIHNRLKKGMPLQMDPTVIYGIYRTKGSFSGNIHKQDLSTDTLWNTYTRKGLPPTPICNPGAASLRAAAAPADVSYLYFVADGSGGHAFASTLAEHDKNVRQWVRIERQRNQGK